MYEINCNRIILSSAPSQLCDNLSYQHDYVKMKIQRYSLLRNFRKVNVKNFKLITNMVL